MERTVDDIIGQMVNRAVVGESWTGKQFTQKELMFSKYANDPVSFITRELGFIILTPEVCEQLMEVDVKEYANYKFITEQQIKVVQAVADNPRVVIQSGHGTGKTFITSLLALWFTYCRVPSQVVTTAPTWLHVEKKFWQQLAGINSTLAPNRFWGKLTKTNLQLGDGWFCTGYNAEKATSIQGFHSDNVMVIMDEATGIEAPFWKAFSSLMMTATDRIVAIGNPTELPEPV
jgi:hypothetical protein